MRKKNPLGDNPLNPEAVLREMVRGDPGGEETQGSEMAIPEVPALRQAPSTITPGGLLRKTVYFTEAEWRAIKAKAYREDRPYTDIVREAVRALLAVPEEPGRGER